jgi:rhamnosyltransferase
MYKVALIIPTRNSGPRFKDTLVSISKQTMIIHHKVIIDTESEDGTIVDAQGQSFEVVSIRKTEFNHGRTRQFGVDALDDVDIVVFMTQDAILVDKKEVENLIECFKDSKVGAAYGRQLPHSDAGPIDTHARLFNYSVHSRVKTIADAKELGIKTAFISNSFAAYRKSALISVGGFPSNTILSEDTYAAAKMLLAGWKVAYCAEAKVYHSHSYNYLQEFRRYFDIGVFHARESWIRSSFGQAEGEGKRFIISELKYLWSTGNKSLISSAFVRNLLKFLGYKLGLNEKRMPARIKKSLSMHTGFWQV